MEVCEEKLLSRPVMARPRILLLSKLFWPEGGGSELATYLILKDILSKHFNVTIVSGTKKPEVDVFRYTRHIYWGVLKAQFKPIEWLKALSSNSFLEKLIKQADIIYTITHANTNSHGS